MSHDITQRAAQPEDRALLYEVYVGARQEEIAAWGWSPAQAEMFLRMQFAARQQGYAAQFPGATYAIVENDGRPIGALLVARTPAAIHLVDIALLPQFRGAGIGRQLIADLIEEGIRNALPVRLSVANGNRAIVLYRRLGFIEGKQDGMYIEMEKVITSQTGAS